MPPADASRRRTTSSRESTSMPACGSPNGFPACGPLGGPFHTVAAGTAAVAPGAALLIQVGVYPEVLTLAKRGHLQATGGTVRIGPSP